MYPTYPKPWAPVVFLHNVVGDEPDIVFDELDRDLAWTRIGDRPRDEFYFNDTPAPYGSGRGRTTYVPETVWHPRVVEIRRCVELELFKFTGCKWALDACFLNRYRDGKDHLGWHADDSPEMDPDRPVVTVSLGATRELWVRPRMTGVSEEVRHFAMFAGDALVMLPGMQRTWQHRVPKADRLVGPRISLTFRGYLPQPAAESPPPTGGES